MKKEIRYATKNEAKVSSLKRVLSEYGINIIHVPLELPEPRTDDLREIARQKVLAAHKEVREPVVALDAGFYIHSLKGFPRAFVNFALKTIGIEGILKLIEDKPRECEFRECLAYYDGRPEEPLIFESSVRGTLTTEVRGRMKKRAWSKLFKIFIPEGEGKTLAQMTSREYFEWSERHHKNSYASKFARWFLGQEENQRR